MKKRMIVVAMGFLSVVMINPEIVSKSDEFSKRALNPVDDTHEGIEKYLNRNPNTCFAMTEDVDKRISAIVHLYGLALHGS